MLSNNKPSSVIGGGKLDAEFYVKGLFQECFIVGNLNETICATKITRILAMDGQFEKYKISIFEANRN